MAAGLPVVVSDIDGYKELVDDGVEGYKAPVVWTGNLPIAELADIMDFKTMQLYLSQCMAVDTASAADSIQRCIDDPASAATMGERGKRRADARYRWSVVIGEYERLWERLYEQSCHEPARADAPAANLFMHDYLHAFSHYPTRILDENDTVTAALQGPGVSAGSGLPPLFEELTALVGRKQVLEIQAMLAGGPATVAQIAGRLKKAGMEPQNVQMTALWMAKYGLVRITA